MKHKTFKNLKKKKDQKPIKNINPKPQKKYEQVYEDGDGPYIEGYRDEWSLF